ncbi:extracellular solute-binding protein [Neobacillus sp. NPDC093127]|uniref:extracellular solute-binding protein n=1 Tax=Neobacillus sp. NPDC093127 TaxID=3364296 RepID=UPI00380452AB
MKKKKLSLLLTASLALSIGLMGCSKDDNKAATDKNEKKEIVLWTSMTGPDGELVQKNIDQYNATKPDYSVKMVKMEGNAFNNKLATVARSGKGVPDVALIASENVSVYQSQGVLDSWDQYIKGTDIKGDNYVKAAWDVGSVEGSQYGLPATMGSWVMYYNKDLVDKYVPGAADDGIITYEEIEKAGAAAAKDGIYAYGFSWPMQNFSNLYMQMGGKFSKDGKPTIDNETAVAALQEFKKLRDNNWMNKKGEDTTKLFKTGKIIFMPEGTWMLNTMNEIKDFTWGETFTPQWDAAKIVQGSGADQFALLKSKERSEVKTKEAVKFIDWLRGNQSEWIKSGANPTALAMLENEDYTKMPQSFLLKTEQGQKAVTIITDPGYSYIFGEVDTNAWDMIQGKLDIKEQLKKIQQTVNDKMAQ